MTTKERLTEEMARKLRSQGYYATGIREILAETGVPKGSMYHHFPDGKQDLACAALKKSNEEMLEKFRAAMSGRSALEGLIAIVEVSRNELIQSEYEEGCPIATVALEVSHSEQTLSALTAKIYQGWEDGLTGFLEKRAIPAARSKAQHFLMRLEGAIILGKVHRKDLYFDLLINDLTDLLKRDYHA